MSQPEHKAIPCHVISSLVEHMLKLFIVNQHASPL